jgi:hypothetical protein
VPGSEGVRFNPLALGGYRPLHECVRLRKTAPPLRRKSPGRSRTDDIAKIDADAKFDSPFGLYGRISLRHFALDLDRATHRVDDAGELDQQAIAIVFAMRP